MILRLALAAALGAWLHYRFGVSTARVAALLDNMFPKGVPS